MQKSILYWITTFYFISTLFSLWKAQCAKIFSKKPEKAFYILWFSFSQFLNIEFFRSFYFLESTQKSQNWENFFTQKFLRLSTSKCFKVYKLTSGTVTYNSISFNFPYYSLWMHLEYWLSTFIATLMRRNAV